MSREHRRLDLWPSDDIAVHIWHMVAVTEDICDLAEASKAVSEREANSAVVKKILVDLKSFDDLVDEFRTTLYKRSDPELPAAALAELKAELRAYDDSLNPSRELLARIRNNLGAHRRGLPGPQERKKFNHDFGAWGAWEQTLSELEAACSLERWLPQLNAAVRLRNRVSAQGLGRWFSFDGEIFRSHVPLRLPDNEDEQAT